MLLLIWTEIELYLHHRKKSLKRIWQILQEKHLKEIVKINHEKRKVSTGTVENTNPENKPADSLHQAPQTKNIKPQKTTDIMELNPQKGMWGVTLC